VRLNISFNTGKGRGTGDERWGKNSHGQIYAAQKSLTDMAPTF